MKLLIKFSDNWADEMDIDGTAIKTEAEYEKYINAAKKAFEHEDVIYFGVGSNEGIEYTSFEQFEKTLTVQPITDEIAEILTHLHFDDYGHFPEYCFEEYYEKDDE